MITAQGSHRRPPRVWPPVSLKSRPLYTGVSGHVCVYRGRLARYVRMSQLLTPTQLKRFIKEIIPQHGGIIKIDFRNAYNSVDRRRLVSEATAAFPEIGRGSCYGDSTLA